MSTAPRPGQPEGVDPTAIPPGAIPDELIDALLDGELDGAAQARLFRGLRHDLKRCEQVARTRRLISMLREQPESPDLTGAVMARVAARRPFLPERWRRMVTAGRMACAASLLLGLLGVSVAHRAWPDAMRLAPVAQPVGDVLRAGQAEASAGVQTIASAVGQVRQRVNGPVAGFRPADPAEVGGPGWPRSVGVDAAPSGRAGNRQSWLAVRLSPGPLTAVREPNFSSSRGSALVYYTGAGTMVSHTPVMFRDDPVGAVIVPLGQHAARVRVSAAAPSCPGLFLLPPTQACSPMAAGLVEKPVEAPAAKVAPAAPSGEPAPAKDR